MLTGLPPYTVALPPHHHGVGAPAAEPSCTWHEWLASHGIVYTGLGTLREPGRRWRATARRTQPFAGRLVTPPAASLSSVRRGRGRWRRRGKRKVERAEEVMIRVHKVLPVKDRDS